MGSVPRLIPLGVSDPTRLGSWRLLGRLGAGGMGVVYLAERDEDHARAALKVIHAGFAGDATFRARFRREVQTSRTIVSDRVAAVVDADADGEPPWLATDYLDGPTLAEQVETEGALPLDEAIALAAALLEGLASIHAAGVVHRDLKPSNVLLTQNGPVIIDFGIASAADATSITATGISVGSAGWMAPEQAIGTAAGPATDVFAWAAVTAFAATGKNPFGAGRADALAYRVAHQEPELAGLPPRLKTLLRGAMAKDPAQRPTIDVLRSALSDRSLNDTVVMAAASESPTEVSTQIAAPTGPQDRPRFVTGRSVAFVVLVFALIAGAIGLYLNADRGDAGVAAGDATTSRDATTTTVSSTSMTGRSTTAPSPSQTVSPLGPRPVFRSDAASGSGCAPGPGPLPDGWWFGYAASTVGGGPAFDFDLACYYQGAIATDMAAADGYPEAPDGYWVSNTKDTLRSVPFSLSAEMRCVTFSDSGSLSEGECTDSPGTSFGIWIRVDDGQATKILEQYAP